MSCVFNRPWPNMTWSRPWRSVFWRNLGGRSLGDAYRVAPSSGDVGLLCGACRLAVARRPDSASPSLRASAAGRRPARGCPCSLHAPLAAGRPAARSDRTTPKRPTRREETRAAGRGAGGLTSNVKTTNDGRSLRETSLFILAQRLLPRPVLYPSVAPAEAAAALCRRPLWGRALPKLPRANSSD